MFIYLSYSLLLDSDSKNLIWCLDLPRLWKKSIKLSLSTLCIHSTKNYLWTFNLSMYFLNCSTASKWWFLIFLFFLLSPGVDSSFDLLYESTKRMLMHVSGSSYLIYLIRSYTSYRWIILRLSRYSLTTSSLVSLAIWSFI